MTNQERDDKITVTSTEFYDDFDHILSEAARGKQVRIIPQGRESDALILIRAQTSRPTQESPDLHALTAQFDELMTKMQTPEAQRATEALSEATPEDIGKAAAEGFKKINR